MNTTEYIDQELAKIAEQLSLELTNAFNDFENRILTLEKKVNLIDNLIKEFAIFMRKL